MRSPASSSLVSIRLPDGLTSLGDRAFYGCSSLVSIALPDRLTSIGGYAFFFCSTLALVYVPTGCSVGRFAFAGTAGGFPGFAYAPTPPPSPPLPPPYAPPPMICLDTCGTAGDDVCQDGGWGAYGSMCEFGTDCVDCGSRVLVDSPPSPPSSNIGAIANV